MTEEISQDLAQRMAALVRDLRADHIRYGAHDIEQDFVARTAAIAAELPKPIDPDLLEARSICASFERSPGSILAFTVGEWDDGATMRRVLAGIKRGRALSQGEG